MPYEKAGKRYIINAGVLNSVLIKTKLLPMAYYDIDKKVINFSCDSITSLLDFFNGDYNSLSFTDKYNLLVKMISDLSKQILFFENEGYFMIGIDFEDICIIDNNTFIIHRDTNFIVGRKLLIPFKKPFFSSPEILSITKLPAMLNNNVSDSYYSLGLLVIYFLTKEKTNKIKDIKPISGTKMYYFLERALQKRILLYI